MADHPTITFHLSKPWSQFSSRVEKGILTNNQIVSNSFYIPYLPCQGAFSDTDVWFSVELFCGDIQIYACDIEFVLFDDMQSEDTLRERKWTASDSHEKYIDTYFEQVECRECYILDGKFVMNFDLDLQINGYRYEQMHGEGSYDWEKDRIVL